jgi:uncharacterized BrkB/YihY/UPF0761 family membrane protein
MPAAADRSAPDEAGRDGTPGRVEVDDARAAAPPPEPESLTGLLSELAGQPVAEGRLGRLQARGIHVAERVTTWGPTGRFVEIGWRAFRRDQAVSGSVLASALTYRLFAWMLPLALLLVAGLGLLSQGGSGDSASYIEETGITGYFAQSVGDATTGMSGFARAALIVSTWFVLVYATYTLLRALRAMSAVTWGVPRTAMRDPVPKTLTLLALLLCVVAAATLTGRISELAGGFPAGWLVAAASLVVAPTFYVLLCALVLPTGADRWTAHLPGAALVYLMVAAIHLFTVLILYPWVAHQKATYGVLGVAAGVLLSLFVVCRALVMATALNAVLQSPRSAQ